MMTDRRVRRTAETDLAIRFWLQSVAHRHGARAVVLADDDGKLISGAECLAYEGEQVATSIDRLFGRDLAAVGPVAYDDVCRTGETDWQAHGKPVRVTALEARSGRYFLVSIGDTTQAEPLAAEAVPGLLRILSSGGPLS